MKRFIPVSLAVCLLIAGCLSLSSCGILGSLGTPGLHEHEFTESWSFDDSSHWHDCSGILCDETSEKEEHVWDEGVVTTEPTPDKKGVKTFTCTDCSYVKTEEVEFNGLTKEAWEAAFDASVFENFAYSEKAVVTTTGLSAESETVYKFTKDNAWVKMTIAGQSQEQFAPDKESAVDIRNQLADSIRSMASYEDYEYDAVSNTYKATKEIAIAALNASTSDVTLKFEDGKLTELKYSVEYTQDGVKLQATSTVTLSEYGTVTFD